MKPGVNIVLPSQIVFAAKPQTSRFVDIERGWFGRLLVLGFKETIGHHRIWYARCKCGNVITVMANQLRTGRTKSCGCLSAETARKKATTHGKSKTKVYAAWMGMKSRCFNPSNDDYENYGGRGITVCERWVNSFENFLTDMGEPPVGEYSIDRKNNNGNYEPENCRWALPVVQCNNKRNNTVITYDGRSQTKAMWCREVGITQSMLNTRLRRGWSFEKAITTAPAAYEARVAKAREEAK